MEMASLVWQALSVNNWLICILAAITSCNAVKSEVKLKLPDNHASIRNQNGIILLENHPFNGILYSLHANGDTASLESYDNGLEHGTWFKFYEQNQLKERREYKKGKKVDTLIAYWPNNLLKLCYVFENNEYHGPGKEWNEQGQLIREMNYNHGYEEGPQKLYYDNGVIKSNYVILNGRRYGLLGTKNCVNVSEKVF